MVNGHRSRRPNTSPEVGPGGRRTAGFGYAGHTSFLSGLAVPDGPSLRGDRLCGPDAMKMARRRSVLSKGTKTRGQVLNHGPKGKYRAEELQADLQG